MKESLFETKLKQVFRNYLAYNGYIDSCLRRNDTITENRVFEYLLSIVQNIGFKSNVKIRMILYQVLKFLMKEKHSGIFNIIFNDNYQLLL